jgi:hypothetical protein
MDQAFFNWLLANIDVFFDSARTYFGTDMFGEYDKPVALFSGDISAQLKLQSILDGLPSPMSWLINNVSHMVPTLCLF